MDIKNLRLTWDNLTNGGPVVLSKVRAIHPYRDGKFVREEISGRSYTVVFPGNMYESQEVDIDDPIDAVSPILKKATYETPVLVEFDDLNVYIHAKKQKDGTWKDVLGASAKAIRIVQASDEKIDFGDIE